MFSKGSLLVFVSLISLSLANLAQAFLLKNLDREPEGELVLDYPTERPHEAWSLRTIQRKRKLPYLLGGIRYKRPNMYEKRALEYLTGGIRYKREPVAEGI